MNFLGNPGLRHADYVRDRESGTGLGFWAIPFSVGYAGVATRIFYHWAELLVTAAGTVRSLFASPLPLMKPPFYFRAVIFATIVQFAAVRSGFRSHRLLGPVQFDRNDSHGNLQESLHIFFF